MPTLAARQDSVSHNGQIEAGQNQALRRGRVQRHGKDLLQLREDPSAADRRQHVQHSPVLDQRGLIIPLQLRDRFKSARESPHRTIAATRQAQVSIRDAHAA